MTVLQPKRIDDVIWELGRETRSDMRVPARIIADEALLEQVMNDKSIEQLLNVATLPGVVDFVVGMPDMHEGYGFPVGGVAAMLTDDGVISPGGIGFDINCGVRLLSTHLTNAEHHDLVLPIVHELSRSIPTGYGRGSRLVVSDAEMDAILSEGCGYVVNVLKLGLPEDLAHLESNGRMPDARPAVVSERAKQRGRDQLGTLGGGNHFLEVQVVDEIFDEVAARALGIRADALTILLHTGSRGLGHQVCTDAVREMDELMPRLIGFDLPDRQLACVPFHSPEGHRYFSAMSAAANFAWSNRQVLTHRVREVLMRVVGARADPSATVVYDVAHNIAKLEDHQGEQVCVHRKGATRAFGPSSPELSAGLRGIGQPIFIPGSMGTASFILVGNDASSAVSFSSSCHGAGRALSRHAAKRQVKGHELRHELEARGIVVRCPSNAELAEEAPVAYKDVERVVDVVARAGIARRVARVRPLGVLKG